MIYILKTLDDMPFWYDGLVQQLAQGLVQQTRVEVIATTKGFDYFTDKDKIIVTSYKSFDWQIRDTKAKIFFYHQGSGACPYFEFINIDHERRDLKMVDVHLFTLPTFEKLTKKYYQLQNTKTIGFPLDLTKYEKYKAVPKKKKIVVSGHITPGKNFYLATYLLKDLIPEYEVWFSVIEREGGVTGRWSTFYKLDEFTKMGFKFVFNHSSQEKFYEFLSDASHVFTCSLSDTIALPIVEGALCGCVPVVPEIYNYWGQYMDYVNYGYSPFSKESVEYLIQNKLYIQEQLPPVINTKWFNSKLVIDRLLEVLV